MGKTNKCNLREGETLAEVVKHTNVCMIKVFLDTERERDRCKNVWKAVEEKIALEGSYC